VALLLREGDIGREGKGEREGRQGRERRRGEGREGKEGRGPPCVSLNFPYNNLWMVV